MALYAIGDTHLSLDGHKPMTVFDGWDAYVERLEITGDGWWPRRTRSSLPVTYPGL